MKDTSRKSKIKSMIDKYGKEVENSYGSFLKRKYNRGPTYWDLINEGTYKKRRNN